MSQTPSSTRRDRKKQQTRRALVDAAILLFAERGIHGTRIEDITERVDLGKGAFYNYFPSKDALIADIVAEGVQTFDDDYLSRMDGGDYAQRVSALAQLHAAFLQERPREAVLFHQARGLLMIQKTRVEGLRSVFADYLRRVGRALVPETEADQWPDAILVDFAAALVGGLAGCRSYRIASALPESESTVQDMMVRLLPLMMQERLHAQ